MPAELISAGGCTVLGVAFRAGGHTLRERSLFLLGWAAGSAFYLTQTLLTDRLAKRRDPPEPDKDDRNAGSGQT